ncbi:MAG: TIGR00730 family Rossman fold protein [Bacteroidetes bacterium]|nr:TIGR00730 family Rossman fold protein [Bacteroidota bacterium]
MENSTKLQRLIPAKEHIYLDGPKPRVNEFLFAWNVFRQFIKGFRALHFVGPCITVFGSARFKPNQSYYKMAEEFGKRIAQIGFVTLTGGGPGIMEAANKGAFENSGTSVGINIKLPFEQHENPYLHKSVTIDYFFVRKTLLIKYSYAFIIMPGGWGTMDELFETLTLIQTKIMNDFPVVLFGKTYHQSLMAYIELMTNEGTITKEDLKYLLLTDDYDEAMLHIATYINQNFKVKPRKRIWWLFEKR